MLSTKVLQNAAEILEILAGPSGKFFETSQSYSERSVNIDRAQCARVCVRMCFNIIVKNIAIHTCAHACVCTCVSISVGLFQNVRMAQKNVSYEYTAYIRTPSSFKFVAVIYNSWFSQRASVYSCACVRVCVYVRVCFCVCVGGDTQHRARQ